MRRNILRRPVTPMDYNETNKNIATHNEIMVDENDMMYIKRHNPDTGKDEYTALWQIAMKQLGTSAIRFKGFKDTKAELLAITDAIPGDMWIVKNDESAQQENNEYIEYLALEKNDGSLMWEQLGGAEEKHRSTIDIRTDEPTNPAEGYCWIS